MNYKILKTQAQPQGREWPDEIVLDVGSNMPIDVYGVADNAFGVRYIRHDKHEPAANTAAITPSESADAAINVLSTCAGCKEPFNVWDRTYRCVDCDVEYHRHCLRKHFEVSRAGGIANAIAAVKDRRLGDAIAILEWQIAHNNCGRLVALRTRIHNIATGAETTASDNAALNLIVRIVEDSYTPAGEKGEK